MLFTLHTRTHTHFTHAVHIRSGGHGKRGASLNRWLPRETSDPSTGCGEDGSDAVPWKSMMAGVWWDDTNYHGSHFLTEFSGRHVREVLTVWNRRQRCALRHNQAAPSTSLVFTCCFYMFTRVFACRSHVCLHVVYTCVYMLFTRVFTCYLDLCLHVI